MTLFVEFSNPLPDEQASKKIKEIAKLINQGFTEGLNMPTETNWKLDSPYSKKHKAIAGSQINNY